MDTLPSRLIAHVFVETFPSPKARAELRRNLEQVCLRDGSCLVDLIFDHERANRQPSDYPSLLRIAAGEADGLLLVRMPLSLDAQPTVDLLCGELTPPLCMLDKAALKSRGLLPKPAPRRAAPARSKQRQAAKPKAQERVENRIAALRDSGLLLAEYRGPTPSR